MDLADVERVVLRPPLAAEGVERMGIVLGVEVEVVVAAHVVLRHAAGRDDALEAPEQRQVVAHHVACEQQALHGGVVALHQHLADGVAHERHLLVGVGLGVSEHQALETVARRILDQRKVDGPRQRPGGLDAAEAQRRRSRDLVEVGELRHQVRVDRGAVAGRLGDEQVHVVVGRYLVASVGAADHDFAPVGHRHVGDPALARVEPAVAVGVQEHGAARHRGRGIGSDRMHRADVARVLGVCETRRQRQRRGQQQPYSAGRGRLVILFHGPSCAGCPDAACVYRVCLPLSAVGIVHLLHMG